MKVSTVTCLFVSKDGALGVRLMDAPVPERIDDRLNVVGIMPAFALGMFPIRTFKRTADGNIPVFEEE